MNDQILKNKQRKFLLENIRKYSLKKYPSETHEYLKVFEYEHTMNATQFGTTKVNECLFSNQIKEEFENKQKVNDSYYLF